MTDQSIYKIAMLATSFSDYLPITVGEFNQIQKAKRLLMFGVALEEKIDLVLENYAEFERDLLNMALDHSIFPGKIYALLDGGTHLANRRIANLLTTTRLYLDQMLHDFSDIYGNDSDAYMAVKESTRREYDSVFGYRVMEEIRNHAQHRSLPTHGISFPMTRDESSDAVRLRFRVVPSVNVSALEDDPKFKKSVLNELLAMASDDKFVSLLPFIREHVESFGRIHQHVRDITVSVFEEGDRVIAEYRARAASKFGPDLHGLMVLVCDSQGLHKDRQYLTTRPTERRKERESKNRHLDSISQRYVSSNT